MGPCLCCTTQRTVKAVTDCDVIYIDQDDVNGTHSAHKMYKLRLHYIYTSTTPPRLHHLILSLNCAHILT